MSPEVSNPTQTQVSFANFPNDVLAKELVEFLEKSLGLVPRCKMKKVFGNVAPHAFVHFESPRVAKRAVKLAESGRLLFRDEWPLKARIDDGAWKDGRRGINSKVYSHIQLLDVKVDLGSVIGPQDMLVSWRGPRRGPVFRIEPSSKRLRFFFTQFLELNGIKDSSKNTKTRCDVMMEIRLEDVKLVQEVEREVDPVLLLKLSSPPWIFYRTAEDDIYEYDCNPSQLAEDEDPWIRCLDIITPDKSIGRCLDYMLTVSPRQKSAFMKVTAFFRSHNVLEKSLQGPYNLTDESRATVSSHIYFFSVPEQKKVPFDLMFLVNALVHHGIVHWSRLSVSFYGCLDVETTPVEVSKTALMHMLTSKRPIFAPAAELESIIKWAKNASTVVRDADLSDGHMVVRRLIITPTRALCLPPEIELSNRVLRHFRIYSDRFLRVSFLDESMRTVPSGSLTVQVAPILRQVSQIGLYQRTTLYERIVSIMKESFKLCGREYNFLAFSAGQLRESSAWFFAGTPQIGVKDIRNWMGTFPDGNVAKHAARMGQCFSATVNTLQVLQSELLPLADIKRDGYDFSDGCGKINPDFAVLVAKILKLDENPPSAYQIRYAGFKGVVAVWPIEGISGKTYKLALRDSMKKFDSNHCQLEIVGWSKFLPCFLNRQIITLLSSLNVKDEVFMKLQDDMVKTLNRMVDNRVLAYQVLKATSSGDLYSTALQMLSAGFDPKKEPHLKAMLVAIRAGQLEELVNKTKIFVPNGRWLLGCLDETAILKYGQCFLRVSDPPKGGICEDKQNCVVVTGTVIMTKNPCMHPGDIRVLEAVNVPELHHIVDCLVVPQNGPRPHPNEASGSDLDGDVYFVSWDETLIPPSRTSCDPMDYKATIAKEMRGHVKTEHVVEFFAKHMVNDSLGKICNAHVVHADRSEKGALDEACLYLAELAAKAVDYPKTGKPAVMPYDLKPTQYPDFMEKEESITYSSEKVIGVLYRNVRCILPEEAGSLLLKEASSTSKFTEPLYDGDLVTDGFEAHVEKAWAMKQAYDQQLKAIMSQFNISSECEVVTGHVMLGAKTAGRRLGDVKERVRFAYVSLLKEYGNLLLSDDACEDSLSIVSGKRLLQRASAWYHVTYHHEWHHKSQEITPKPDVNQRPFLSFAWVAVEQLVTIKTAKLTQRRVPIVQKKYNPFFERNKVGKPVVLAKRLK